MHKDGPPWGEGSTNCYETAKYKTKRRILHPLERHISFFIKKKAYYSCTKDSPYLLLEDPPLSRKQK
jgi:hypothetical protein